MPRPTTISLVLGSGGARGLAHIGVLDWLVENGYEVRSIAGSSMGALVGGIFATGKLRVYSDWVTALDRIDVLRLLDLSFAGSGLFKGERIMGVLREMIGECAIEDLPLAFTAVATDLDSGKEVWLREGPLFDAIRASIATPLLFTPHTRAGRRLLDGALVNPIPIAPTLNDMTDLTIAVDLSARGETAPGPVVTVADNGRNGRRRRIRDFIADLYSGQTPQNPALGPFTVALASMEAMQTTISRLKMAAYSPDIMVDVPIGACAFHEFWRAREMIALGRARVAAAFTRAPR